MNCQERLEMYLRENQVPYVIQHHPRAYTAERVAASEHIPGRLLAKVVMAIADGEMIMLVLPATENVMHHAERALGAKQFRLAEEEEFRYAFPGCEVGAMPPFGNLYNIPVYVDESLAMNDIIYFQAGTHTETMSLKFEDFFRLVKPIIITFRYEPQYAG